MEALYLVAILPPASVDGQLRQFKQEFSERFPDFKSISILPHITLIPPFKAAERQADFLAHDLTELSKDCAPFSIGLYGFGHFDTHTIYAEVQESAALARLFTCLRQGAAHPHMTIGYRNRKAAAFADAWAAFGSRPYEASFMVNSYWLLQFIQKSWRPLREIPLLQPDL